MNGRGNRSLLIGRGRDVFLHAVRTGYVAHLVPFSGMKRPEHEAGHSLPPNAEVKNAQMFTFRYMNFKTF